MQDESGHRTPQHHELLDLFDELTVREKIDRVMRGLKSSHDSGDYKYAKLQLIRLSAPLAAVVVPILALCMLMAFAAMRPPPPPEIEVQILDPEALEELDDIDELMDEPIEPPEPIEIDFTQEVPVPQTEQILAPAPPTDFSPQPSTFDSVAIVRSPVIMRGIFGSRNPGARGSALAQYSQGMGGLTEGAVIRALRWLKKEQADDGSWTGGSPANAMTGFGLLTFLAHGETPASEEFGPTVEKAIRFLVSQQRPDGVFPGNYDIPIAAYAISEAYGLTKVPMLKDVMERAVDFIIKGQHPTGGWMPGAYPGIDNRQMITRKQGDQDVQVQNPMFGKYRDDTSYMGWCAQALKAANMAGCEHPELKKALRLAVKGFQQNAHPEGGFGYTGPGAGGLTGVGVLCMQLLGAAKLPECRKGVTWLERVTCDWAEPWGGRPIYYWYYITQAKFHHGGKVWSAWNRQFARQLVDNQTVVQGAGVDGKDIGYWDSPGGKEEHGLVYNTTLCALMLQVYYRYLPTYKPAATVVEEDIALELEDEVQIEIEI